MFRRPALMDDGEFLLVASHYIALVCNYCFLLWLIKYLSIYLSVYKCDVIPSRLLEQFADNIL